MYIFLIPAAIVALLALPVISRIKNFTDGTKCRNAIIGNLCTFFGIMLLAVILPVGGFVSAEVVEETAGVISSLALRATVRLSIALITKYETANTNNVNTANIISLPYRVIAGPEVNMFSMSKMYMLDVTSIAMLNEVTMANILDATGLVP